MQTDNLFRNVFLKAAVLGVSAGISLPASADQPLDDLDAPMAVFDGLSEVPPAVADMPVPNADPAGAAYNDVPSDSQGETEPMYDDGGEFADDRGTSREVLAEYDRDLSDSVREGFVFARQFEGANRPEERLGRREDYFHVKEGEDVDLEDGFNDEAEVDEDPTEL